MSELQDFGRKAETDGSYAIAFALLHLAEAVDRMGMNRLNPAGPPGTTEKIAMETERLTAAVESVAEAIQQQAHIPEGGAAV